MADKSVGELIAAQSVTPTDLFVLEQNGTAKKLTGQILENWLVSFADGHGGIQSIAKLSTSGLVDTYRITLADTTVFDFTVTNGKSITGIAKTGTSGLVDTYKISYNDGSSQTYTVTNGAKGDKGDNAYIWIKYASQKPTEASHSMGDIPDNWIGVYSGNASSAPTDWKQYQWFEIKGEKGDTGAPSTLVNKSVTYQVSDSGTIIPSGSWGSSIPVVPQGKYLWTKTEVQFNTGDPIVSYSVTRMGMDGSGSVSSVAGVSPNETGNVTLTAADVGAPTVEELNTLVTTVGGKQPTTNSLGTETDLADGDFIPFYDTSASANKKTLWSNIVAKIRTALFGSANGFLKADGSGNISAEGSIKTADLADGSVTAPKIANGAVTRAKLAQDALISPFKFFAGDTYSFVADDIGVTIMNSFVSGDSAEKTVNLTYEVSHAFPIGTILIVARPESNPVKISFGENIRVGIPGNDSWIASPTVSISNRFSTVALTLKSSGAQDYWILTGEAEVVT